MTAETSKISKMILGFLYKLHDKNFTIQQLIDNFQERSFGILFIIIAIPNLLMLTILPGFSTVLGIMLIIMSVTMILNRKIPWVPKFISQKKLSIKTLESILMTCNPFLSKIDKILKTRLTFMISEIFVKLTGVICLLHGILMALPIPLANFLCGLAIALFGIGMIFKDGIFILLGYLLSLFIFIFFSASFHLIIELAKKTL